MIENNHTIFTLNARGNVLLEVTKEYFNLSDKHIFREIVGAHRRTVELLAQKKIDYSNLKSALIPNPKRNEIVLVFDSLRIENSWYGLEVFKQIIPLFERASNHSVLCGDLIGGNNIQDGLRKSLRQHLNAFREYEFRHSNQFYLVYINNLSEKMVTTFIESVRSFGPYIGFINFNYSSALKAFVSLKLPSLFVKHRNVVIQPHPDDVDDSKDENTCGYPFKENGYECRSIAGMYYGMFLEYKIECPTLEGFESDTLFSLNAISDRPLPFSDFEVELDERKLGYLVDSHGSSLKFSGIELLTREEIVESIRERINSNYIFNMNFDKGFDVAKFNIVLEFEKSSGHPFKLLLSMEYKAKQKLLRVITMY